MHVVHETTKVIISRRENLKKEKVCEMFKHEKCTCKACEIIVQFSLSNMQICAVLVNVFVLVVSTA